MNITVESIDGCINFFLEINTLLVKELLKKWMTGSSVKINIVPFKEWMTAILSVTRKLLFLINNYNRCYEIVK